MSNDVLHPNYEAAITNSVLTIDDGFEIKPASRSVWRSKSGEIKNYRATYKIPVSYIKVIGGWNPRTVFDGIEELANDIIENDLIHPIQGDLSDDGSMFFIRDGERRYRAILYAIHVLGASIEEVEVMPYPVKHTDLDKLIENLSSDKKSKYDNVDMSSAIIRLKENYDLSNLEIAKRLGYSRQWVDNMILFARYEDKEAVRNGLVHFSDAVASVRAKNKSDKNDDDQDGGDGWKPVGGEESPAATTTVPSIEPPADTTVPSENPAWNVVPSKEPSHLEELQAGLLGPSKNGGDRDDLARMKKESEEGLDDFNDQDYQSEEDNLGKEMLWTVNKLESFGSGLNEDLRKDFDGLLHHLRTQIDKATTVSHIYGNRFDDVSHELISELVKTSSHGSKVSDGYHSFEELYNHRHALCVALSKAVITSKVECWRSELHSDGSKYEGWFIVGFNKEPGKQISYHVPIDRWNEFDAAETLDRAPEYDGHSSKEVIERLKIYV